MFYVSKRQTILLLETLFYSFSIEKNISLANTVPTIVKLKEMSRLPCKRSCAECFATCPRKHFPSFPKRVMSPNVPEE
jgi:hypothetical protein